MRVRVRGDVRRVCEGMEGEGWSLRKSYGSVHLGRMNAGQALLQHRHARHQHEHVRISQRARCTHGGKDVLVNHIYHT
jgi:hypothetical protein